MIISYKPKYCPLWRRQYDIQLQMYFSSGFRPGSVVVSKAKA